MERLSVTDHVTGLFQTARNPMNIAGLLLFEVAPGERADFARRMREHLAARLPATPLATRLVRSPEGYGSNAWFRISAENALALVSHPQQQPASPAELRDYVTAQQMVVIDTTRAPFEVQLLDAVDGPHCAMLIKVHHTRMDGIGFQQLLELLSDQGGALPVVDTTNDEAVPSPEDWLEIDRQGFAAGEAAFQAQLAAMGEAQERLAAFLADPAHQRQTAPEMAFGSEITTERAYRTLDLPLAGLKAAGRPLGATVNDLFLAVAAGGLRQFLLERGLLPDAPLVSHSVRSTRRAEDGMTGNRVASIYPELATDEPDRHERLRRIMRSMALEKQRSALEEPLLEAPEAPYGTRDREIGFADPAVLHAALGSANVVLSNVPGPEVPPSFAGFRLAGNYPVPIVGPARFLNITSRRNGDQLNLGIMVDSAKITEIDALVAAIRAEAGYLTAL